MPAPPPDAGHGSRTLRPRLPAAPRSGTRRRPSGEPPPLPRHVRASGFGWIVAAFALISLSLILFAARWRGPAVAVTVVDDAVVRGLSHIDNPALVSVARGFAWIGSLWLLTVLLWCVVLSLVALRRFRHLIVFLVSWTIGAILFQLIAPVTQRPRPFGVPLRGEWVGWSLPSLPVTVLSAIVIAVLYTLVPEGRVRNIGKWIGVALVGLMALGRLTLGIDAPSDVAVAAAIGVAIPLVAYRMFTPSEVFPVTYRRGRAAHLDVGGERGEAIRRALREQLGLVVTDLRPFGLAGSAGSTPLRIEVADLPDKCLFGKLYAENHLRSDRWYKLGRELLYGRLEDEKPFHTVRRLVQQEDYALRLFRDCGLPTPAPYGVVELTPEREYLLMTEFLDGAVELGEADVDDEIIDSGLRIVRQLWDAGLAHRDVKPSNLLVRDRQVWLIDVAFAELRPTPWRQAVDLANMMLCLALRSSVEHVYQRALLQFTVDDIGEAFAAARGLALPSQLRRALRAQGRDLHGEFIRLLPAPPKPVRIQRWNIRRVVLWAVVLIVAALIVQNRTFFSFGHDDVATLRTGAIGCDDLSPMWLTAQALPSASVVPCQKALPAGWWVAQVEVRKGHAMYRFGHDRAGPDAMVATVSRSCPATSSRAAASRALDPRVRRTAAQPARPGADGGWQDSFAGGCVTVRLHSTDSDPAVAAEVTTGAPLVLGYVDRRALQAALAHRSDDRLHLDP